MDLERAVLDIAPVMVRSLEGRVELWTSGMANLYGFSKSEAIGRLADDLLGTIYRCPADEIEAALAASGRWRGEVIERGRGGASLLIDSECTLLRDEAGAPCAIMVLNAVTSAANAAQSDQWRLASIVEGSHDAIISKTLDGVVTSWNDGAVEVFGFSAREMIGQPITVLIPPDRLEEERDILGRLRQGERIENYETVRRRKDGRDIHVSLSVSPIRDARGQIVGASKIARDIDDQKTMQARFDDLQAELFHISRLNDMGQLALAFAHELNQPLSAASNYLSGTRRLIETGDCDRALGGCDKAAQQLVRTGEVVRRLRDFVKKGEGARQSEVLAQVVEEGCALALVGARADGASTRFELGSGASEAIIDKVQIQQVLVNLVRNALEAMAGTARREIIIRTSGAAPGFLEVAVADSGPGLTAVIRQKLFQPFNTSKASGMGVGLSLCRAIVEAHGGNIWADDNPGGGAVFRFTVPCGARPA
jgi:two-component system sensor kinase FixL